jgi:hypothetical protein
LEVAGFVWATDAERDYVVNDIAWAGSFDGIGSRAGIEFTKGTDLGGVTGLGIKCSYKKEDESNEVFHDYPELC